MSEDNVIQFVPSQERLKQYAAKWLSEPDVKEMVHGADTAPSEYVAPTDDCA